MFQILSNETSKTHRQELAELLGKHFNNPDWKYELAHYEPVYDHPFFVMNLGREEGRVNAFIDLSISTKGGLEGLIRGKLKEHDVVFYPRGSNEPGYLFFMTLLVENKRQTPFLVKGAFAEVEKILRAWKINITHVYTMAYTKVSERLMRRHGMEQVGLYEGHYPIMAVKVMDHPYLRALIPHADTPTEHPFRRSSGRQADR
jgi:hypothetical protein